MENDSLLLALALPLAALAPSVGSVGVPSDSNQLLLQAQERGHLCLHDVLGQKRFVLFKLEKFQKIFQ